ncbi:hypothetical protein K7T73_12880 [Bacillus badius]|uniref:hypothetical protein n=1 Tax=Bacillus badius TaxID=1455 RepID=UPI001CBED5EA|nr:hypothetical protein [Bacillus badius]UAT29494.1 hypothetical protein K7T73_12880 [Bacillus badius]
MIDIREHGGIFGGGKYRKGSFIPFSKIAPFQPLRFIMYYPNNSYNQGIHRKYASDETGNVFIPIYEATSPHKILVYDKNGEKINTILWEFSTYGAIFGMVERNGYLFVFSDGACIKFDISTGQRIQGDATSDWRISPSSKIIQKENIVYAQTTTNSLVKLDLDTFTVISKYIVLSNPAIYLKAIDDNENAYFIGGSGYLLKYSNTGTLIFNNKLKHTANNTYSCAIYSKTKNSILVVTFDNSLKKGYIEEWGLDGVFKKEVDISPHLLPSYITTANELFKTNDVLIVCTDAGAILLNENDLSFIKKIEGVFYSNDHSMYVSNKYIISRYYTGSDTISAYSLGVEII